VLFVPTFEPLSFHWYDGVVPPLVGVAVNVTLVPVHIAPDGFADIEMLAGKFGLIVTGLVTCADGPLQPLAVTWIFTLP
jgi:hypothetical protein